MNSWNIEKRIALIKDELINVIKKAVLDYKNGEGLMTEAEFYNKLFHSINNFYKSIGKPKLEVIPAWGPPYAEDHNGMIDSIIKDLYLLLKDNENVLSELRDVSDQVTLEESAYLQRIKDIENHIEQVVKKIESEEDILVFRDHFGTTKFFNIEGSKSPASISTDEQVLTLRKEKEERFNEYATIRVVKGNGLPGNTKIANASEDTVIFEGETAIRTNLADVLDGNLDTWFEFERIHITDDTYTMYENKGFEYEENIPWANREIEKLMLVVQVEFEKERLINWFSTAPYIPFNKGSIAAIIEKIVIEDSSGKMQGYGFEEKFNHQKAFMIGDVSCKRATIYLRQEIPYEVYVGHPYHVRLPVDYASTMGDDNIPKGTRVHGMMPSVHNLEVSYDKGEQEVVFPTYSYGHIIEDEDVKKNALFNTIPKAVTGEDVVSGFELIRARRYAIGLKDIHLKQLLFSEESQYISYPFTSESPIKEIELFTSHEIPEVFGEGEWIKYYISVDQGNTWHQIYDQVSDKSEAKIKYFINSGSPVESRLEEYGYLELGEDAKEVMVRIDISRPSGNEYNKYTPIVYNYELHVSV